MYTLYTKHITHILKTLDKMEIILYPYSIVYDSLVSSRLGIEGHFLEM
jgi:hypothetical protein